MNTIKETNLDIPGQTNFYRGKVRDIYFFKNRMAMVATDRISAFDVILPEPIPYKGIILNQMAATALENTKDIVPNWLRSVPHPRVSAGLQCTPIPVEMVIRGYLAGHAWREYRDGKRELCGVPLPEGLKENDPLPQPIITPTTKASEGHDMDISKDEIIRRELVDRATYEKLEEYTHKLYRRGYELSLERGLLLVDTKYEFGFYNNEIYLMDEVHTPDSSRFFYASGYKERQEKGEKQQQLSKEFVREWLIENGFQGQEGQSLPAMTKDVVTKISERYQELYANLTGQAFQPPDSEDSEEAIRQAILSVL